MTSPWADLVAAADPALVLPVRPRGAAVEVAGPLSLVDLVDLGDGHGVGVVQTGDGDRWTVPLVREGDVFRAQFTLRNTSEDELAVVLDTDAATARATASPASTPVPTTTWSSPSNSTSWAHAFARCCVASPGGRSRC